MAADPVRSTLHELPVIVTDATTKSIYCIDRELTLDFGLADGLNRFVTLADLDTVELRLTGHAFGRKVTKAATAALTERR